MKSFISAMVCIYLALFCSAEGFCQQAVNSGPARANLSMGGISRLTGSISATRTNLQTDTINYGAVTVICQGSPKLLRAENAPSPAQYRWLRNGTIINGASSASYNATTAGEYAFWAITGTDTLKYQPVTLTLATNPVASFSVAGSDHCSGTPIQFNASATGGKAPYRFIWKFADGTSSSSQNPEKILTSTGCGLDTLENTLIVIDDNGCSDTIVKPLVIKQAPDVGLRDRDIFTPFSNCDNSPSITNPNFTLEVLNFSKDASCIASYSLDWGDGTVIHGLTASSFPLTHTYTALGVFYLTVTAKGTNGCTSSRTYEVANQVNPAGGLGTLGSTTGLCAPATLPFIISNWQDNSPGTKYILNFGDGDSVILMHPLNPEHVPDTVYHTYTESSCPTPTFTATLTVINACDNTPYSAGNIQIRIKPAAIFDSVPPSCVGTPVCFINETIQGNFGPTCNSLTQYTWNFGDPASGDKNISGEENPCHVFSAPGIYTVTLTATNPCGSSVFTRQICIVEKPRPDFELDKDTACMPVVVRTTNTTTGESSCSPMKYKWSVTYIADYCGNNSAWSYASGTNDSSVSPVFRFTEAGRYRLTLAVTNACGTYYKSKIVHVKRPPKVTLNNVDNICGPVTINPGAIISSCGNGPLSYQWTFSGGVPAGSNQADPGNITFTGTGVHTITLKVTNECGTTTATEQFEIYELPDLTIPPNDTVCENENAGPYVFSSTSPAATITWSANNRLTGLPASTGTGNIPAFVAANTSASVISSNIVVTSRLAGCKSESSFSISVNPAPAAPAVTPVVNYCLEAQASPLTATLTGKQLNWYTTATGGAPLPEAPVPSTTTPGTVSYYVSQTSAAGCEGPRSRIDVKVRVMPVISAESVSPNACGASNGSITLKGLDPNTPYEVRYQRNGVPVTLTRNSGANGHIILGSLNAATYSDIMVVQNECATNIVGPLVLSDPNPPAAPEGSSNGPVCSGGDLLLKATASGSGVIYNWTGPNQFSSTAQNPVITNAPENATGAYYVTATVNGCTSLPDTLNVVIHKTPANPAVSSNGPLCSGDALRLSAAPAPNGPLTYAWTGPGGFTSSDQQPVIPDVTASDSGFYEVTITDEINGCQVTAGTVAVVRTRPQFSSVLTADPLTCSSATGSITLKGLNPGKAYQVKFKRNGSAVSLALSAGSTGDLKIDGLTAGTYTDIYVELNGCASASAGPFTLSDPNPPVAPVLSYNGPLCAGSDLKLSATASQTSGVTWNWTGPGGFSSNQKEITITNVSPSHAGTYYATVTVNNCTSPAGSVDVVIYDLPSAPAVISPVEICMGTQADSLKATALAGHALRWYTDSAGGSFTTEAPVPNTTAVGTFRYFVSQVSPEGCEGPRAAILVTVRPDAQADYSFTADTSCAPFLPEIINRSDASIHNRYEWFVNGVSLGSGQSFPGYVISSPADSADIRLIAISAFGCRADTMDHRFYTRAVPAPSFTVSDTAGCGPLQVTLNNTTPQQSLFSYIWDFGNGQTSTNAQPGTITLEPAQTYGDTVYPVTLKAFAGCDTFYFTKYILVKSKPKSLFTPDKSFGCSPMTVVFNNISRGYASEYLWQFGDGTSARVNSADTISHTYYSGIRDTIYARLISTNSCGRDTLEYAIAIAPNAVKIDMAVNGNELSGCLPHEVSFINNTRGGSVFRWEFGDGSVYTSFKNIDTVKHVYTTPGVFNVTLYASNGCSDTSATETVKVFTTALASFDYQTVKLCAGDSVRFNNTSDSATSVLWEFGDGTSSVLLSPTHFYTVPGTYAVKLTTYRENEDGFTCSDTATTEIVVLPKQPSGEFIYEGGNICKDEPLRFEIRGMNTDSVLWDFGDGTVQSSTGNVAYHQYSRPGFYLPSVKLINSAGCELLIRGTDTVEVDEMRAGFSWTSDKSCGKTVVTFRDTSYVYLKRGPVKWLFGDGTTGEGPEVTHTYSSGGQYMVSMIMTVDGGCVDTAVTFVDVDVFDLPVADILMDASACTNKISLFNASVQSRDSVETYRWFSSAGVTGIGKSFAFEPFNTGDLTIELIVGTTDGCFDTVSKTLPVYKTPLITKMEDKSLCIGESVQLNTSGAETWRWEPGGGLSCVDCPSPLATPDITTEYIVTGFGEGGCFSEDTVLVKVIRPFKMETSSNDTLCLGEAVTLWASGAENYSWTPSNGLSRTNRSTTLASPRLTTVYRVVGWGEKSCFSDTAFIEVAVGEPSPISLGPDQTLPTGTLLKLQPVVGLAPAKTWEWLPDTDLSCSDCPEPVATIRNDITYRVNMTNIYGCKTSDTISIKTFCENAQVFIPNAFTPDGDGVNDKLILRAKGIARVTYFRIFNRWGETVFEKYNFLPNDINSSWDGRIRGVVGGPEVFVYTAEVICENGTRYVYKGNVSIIK